MYDRDCESDSLRVIESVSEKVALCDIDAVSDSVSVEVKDCVNRDWVCVTSSLRVIEVEMLSEAVTSSVRDAVLLNVSL